MNTIKILILAVLITLSSSISANADSPKNDLKLVSQQIQTLLKDSEITIHDEVMVNVKIKLNNNNKIIEVYNDSKNKEISKFLNKKLNLKEILIDKKSNYRFYVIPVKFLSTVY
jgi:hypothetical protein